MTTLEQVCERYSKKYSFQELMVQINLGINDAMENLEQREKNLEEDQRPKLYIPKIMMSN